MLFGLDFLGGARYRAEIKRSRYPLPGLGIFWFTFGDSKPVIIDAAQSNKITFERVQGIWKDDHRFTANDFDLAIKIAKELGSLASRYPKLKWYYSPFCEHDRNAAQMSELQKRVKAVAPNLIFVNTPNKGNNCWLKDAINEVHNTHRRPPKGYKVAFSNDGEGCVDVNIQKRKKDFSDAEYFMLWDFRFNGFWEEPKEGEPKPPREKRDGWPDQKHIKSVARLAGPIKVKVNLPPGWLWKSHAENEEDGVFRGEKPVLICPYNVAEVKLVSRVGHVIATLKNAGRFDGGGYRFYSNKWGFELERDMIAESAKSEVFFFVNGKKFGPVNPSFRAGKFR